MRIYNASSLIKLMQTGFAETQEETGRLLLNTVVEVSGMQANNITGKTITKLVKRTAEVAEDIRSFANQPDFIEKAKPYVSSTIIPRINDLLIHDMCVGILNIMREDTSVPDEMVNRLNTSYIQKDFVDFFTAAILYALSRGKNILPEEINQEDFSLLKEVGYKCPMCEQKLWRKGRGKNAERIYKYRIVKIYPEDLEPELTIEFDAIQMPPRSLTTESNLIAMCRDCADAYIEEPNVEDYTELVERKKTTSRLQKARDAADGSSLEKEIADIIKAIAGIDRTTELKPFTDALTLPEKIHDNFLLENTIQENVVKYYSFIEKQFSILDGGSLGSHFRIIASEITACYEKLEAAGLNQEEICAELATWILNKTPFGEAHQTAGNIVVSFFVQNCEVFHASAE